MARAVSMVASQRLRADDGGPTLLAGPGAEPERSRVKTDNELDKAGIVSLLREAYGLPVTRLEFTPKGEAGYCYVAWSNGDRRWFVKLFQAHRDEPFAFSLRASRDLHDAGYEHALPPIRTDEGEPFATYDGYAVTAFPYVEGVSLLACP